MSKFEDLLNETSTLEEALSLQPCLEDNLSEYEVERIRAEFLEEWFNISVYEYAFLMNIREKRKKTAFDRAVENSSPAWVVYQVVRK